MLHKDICLAQDVSDKWGMDPMALRNIISGEPQDWPEKFNPKGVFGIVEGQTLLTGNEPKQHEDPSGALTRRYFSVAFIKPPKTVKYNLPEMLRREESVSVLRDMEAYLALRRRLNSQPNLGLDAAIDPYFAKTAQRATEENPVEAFWKSGSLEFFGRDINAPLPNQQDPIKADVKCDVYIPLVKFREALTAWCDKHHIERPKWNKNANHYEATLRSFGVHIAEGLRRQYPRGETAKNIGTAKSMHGKMLFGIDTL
jgi:hypothetical protein